MASGLDSYKFGSKNNWRRRIWNEAVKRLRGSGKKISECVVVYLPGPDNIDGEIATSKGFKPWNLYAVEIDKKRTNMLRSKKVNVINEDLNTVLTVWNAPEKIDFVFADFCGGITHNAIGLILNLLLSECFNEKAVVAVNLLRGRDSHYLKAYGFMLKDINKHRGLYFYRILMLFYCRLSASFQDLEPTKKLASKQITFLNKMTELWANPHSLEYKSKCGKATLVMDSLIFNWGSAVNFTNTDRKIFKNISHVKTPQKDNSVLNLTFDYNCDFSTIRRKIGASRAIHTMRRNGTI